MLSRTFQLSFNGGEVSPRMSGRFDARYFASGVARMQNWYATPQGPVRSRPGLQFVVYQYDSTHACNVLDFTYSTGQALAVEFGYHESRGLGYLRLHTDAGTVLWADPVEVGEQASDAVIVGAAGGGAWLKTEARHGFSTGDAIRLTGTGTSLPSPLVRTATYYVIARDSRTFYIEAASTGLVANALAISAQNTGYLRAFHAAELPREFIPKATLLGGANVGQRWDEIARVVDFTAHGYEDGDGVQFIGTPGSAIPLGFVSGQTYYVHSATANNFKLSDTLGGPDHPIVFTTGTLTSPFDVQRSYLQGELVFWAGTTPILPGVYYVHTDHIATLSHPTVPSTYVQTGDGILTIPTPYLAADLPDLHDAQNGDVLTITHDNHVPYNLSRLGASTWTLTPNVFGSELSAPTNLAVTENRGERFNIVQQRNGNVIYGGATLEAWFRGEVPVPFAKGDGLYCETATGAGNTLTADTYYTVARILGSGQSVEFSLTEETSPGVWSALSSGGSGTISITGHIYRASPGARRTQTYKVSAVGVDDIEGPVSSPLVANNVLEARGAANTLTWDAVSGADRYFVYKEENGLYGFVGETEGLTFEDDNIGPDFKATPPLQDAVVTSGSFKPTAVTFFEQRRAFAKDQTIWMSRVGAPSDFSYAYPIRDDDRIEFTFASNQAHTVRHLVTLGELLVLTAQGEWRATAVNSDAITPSTVSIRPQSYIGASMVQPAIINSSVIYCAARGGRVRELGYQRQLQGYSTGDVSLRAAHLFDGYELLDLAYQKAPIPVCWFPSSSGKLLGFTYVPEEEVGSWSQTVSSNVGGDAEFESACVLAEGEEDRLYVSVKRTVNNATVRSIERLGEMEHDNILTSARMDQWVEFDGAMTGSVTLSGGITKNTTVTVTATDEVFSTFDVGTRLRITSEGIDYWVKLQSFTSITEMVGKLETDLPFDKRHVALSDWSFAAQTMTGLGHLEGEVVKVVWSSASSLTPTIDERTVIGGAVTISGWATRAFIGVGYRCEIETLPVALQAEAAGQGRLKNVNVAHVRTEDSGPLQVGLTSGDTVPVEDLAATELQTGEFRAVVTGDWNTDGRVLIRQDAPVPATVVGMSLEVSVAQ